MSRRAVTLTALLLIPSSGQSNARAPQGGAGVLSADLRAIIESPKYASARWGVRVVDAATGQVLEELNPSDRFLTGSTAKIFSVATALATLGPDHRFETAVFRNGAVDASGTLDG